MTLLGIEMSWKAVVLVLAGLVALLVVALRTQRRRRRMQRVLRQTQAAVRAQARDQP